MKYIFQIIVFPYFSSYIVSQNQDLVQKTRSFDYEFEIGGDFDADGDQDVIAITFQSKASSQPIPDIKYFNSEDLIHQYCNWQPQLILSSKTGLSQIIIHDSCDVAGPFQLMNLGDLNDNGGDEIALLLDGFYDVFPTFQVYTYCNRSWVLVNSFKMYYREEFGKYVNIDYLIKQDEKTNKNCYIDEEGTKIDLMKSYGDC